MNGQKGKAMAKNNKKNTKSANTSRNEVYQILTDRVVEALKTGVIPWEKPWFGTSGAWGHCGKGKKYSLLNCLLLPEGGEYITFKQMQAEGGQLKEGAKSHMICFYKLNRKEDTEHLDENGDPTTKTWATLKYYRVFRIEDTTVPQRYHLVDESKTLSERACNRKAEAILTDYLDRAGIKVLQDKQGNEAFYRPSDDTITLPLKKQFKDKALYYKTCFHEAVHSTGAESRLAREVKNMFGSAAYAREELVAELGAASLLNRCKLFSKRAETNSAAYIQNWLGALENDPKLIAWAAVRAQKAADYIDPTEVELEGEEPVMTEEVELDLVAGAGIA